jgi:hypothetical protein
LRQPRRVGAAGIRGGGEALLAERFDILLALANEHDRRFKDFPEAVEYLARGFPVYPATIAIRPPLKEAFGFGPNHLVQEIAGFVGIVVFSDDPAVLTWFLFGPEATSLEGDDYSMLLATRVAVDQYFTIHVAQAQ